jgi:hypothetical protein
MAATLDSQLACHARRVALARLIYQYQDPFTTPLHAATIGEIAGANLVWRSHRDGVLGAGASLLRNASSLSLGLHTITLAATGGDGTIVEASVQISITSIIAPRLQTAPSVSGGNLDIEVFGEMGTQVTLESSVDLRIWTTVQSAVFETDRVEFTIPLDPNEPQRFYRATAAP